MLAHRATALGPVYCDESWGNIYRTGDYCPPHAHVRADVSVVYMVDAGDAVPDDGFSGKLMFLDPRIEWCCSREPGRPTRPFIPDMIEGTMVAFAGEFLHSVNPYTGQRPRVTLSWNFTSAPLAEAGRRDWSHADGRPSRPTSRSLTVVLRRGEARARAASMDGMPGRLRRGNIRA
jgi:hypothetical protein